MSIREYRDICQKGDSENYIIDKYIYRKVSIYCTILLIKLNISANSVTTVSLIATLGSLWFFTQNEPIFLLIGSFLAFIYHYLDHVDGELARYYIEKGMMKSNLRGQYFDVLCHSYSINLMFLCTGFALYNKFGYGIALVLGFIAMLGSSSFHNLVATKVLVIKIANNPNVIRQPSVAELLLLLERKKIQTETINAPSFSKAKIIKLIKELNGYPGIISIFIITACLDAFSNNFFIFGIEMDFRLLLLIPVSIIRLFYMPFKSYRWMKKFENII